MPKRISIEVVKKDFTDRGATPLFDKLQYKSPKSILPFRCPCGNTYKIMYQELRYCNKNPRCPNCMIRKKIDYEEVRQSFIKNDCIPLFDKSQYKNPKSQLPFKCPCGNTHKIMYQSIKYDNRIPRCPDCWNVGKPTYEEIKSLFIKSGATPLFDKYLYKNNATKLPFKCKCGNKHEITYAHIKRNQDPRCPDCYVTKSKFTLEEVRQVFIKHGATPLFTEYKNHEEKLPFICKCGEKHELAFTTIFYRDTIPRCPSCYFKAIPRGKTHANYKHDISDYERKYGRMRNPMWKIKVLRRDRYTCVISGIKGQDKVCAHHIYNFADYKELKDEISNGITISRDIHKEYHSLYGNQNNTLDQFREFYHTKTGNDFTKYHHPLVSNLTLKMSA